MKYGSGDIGFLYIDGYDPTDVSTELDTEVTAETEETTPFGGDWTTHEFVGVKSFEINQVGFFDDAANSINAALAAHTGTERILCFAVDDTLGAPVIAFSEALQTTYNILGSVKGLHRANAKYAGNGAVHKCKLLVSDTVTGDDNGSSLDNAAASDLGGIAYLQVPTITLDGGTNIIVSIQHSVDGLAGWDQLVAFVASTARSAQTVALPVGVGAIRQYVRASWSWTGGGAGRAATFAVAIKRY